MAITHNGVRLDGDALHLLACLNTHESLNTTEAKNVTGIDDNDKVRRRFERLNDAGLVELGKDEDTGSPLPPVKAVITAAGREKVDEWDIDEKTYRDADIEERLDRIDRRLDGFDDRLTALENAATSGPKELHDLEEARKVLVSLRRYLAEEHDADFGPHWPRFD